jgi:hypothetical protein
MLAQRQQSLQQELNRVIQGLNQQGLNIPDGLNQAGEAMGQAQGELSNQDFASATRSQQEALDRMRDAGQQLARQLNGNQNQQAAEAQRVDPLGRPVGANGQLLGGALNIPDIGDLQRAREILDELRRRAAELGRSQEELDYIERLLKLF